MQLFSWIGILGSLLLVIGAARPVEKTTAPTKSVKNWLFAIGEIIMLLYVIVGYMHGGSIFFVLLEILVVIACILMMLDTDDRFDSSVIIGGAIILLIRSLSLFEWYSTIIFVLGLSLLGLGYAFQMNTMRRDIALILWSILVAWFSVLEANRIFFWLNTLFAAFSLYYALKLVYQKKRKWMI